MRPDASRETQTFSSTDTSTASCDLGDAAERGGGGGGWEQEGRGAKKKGGASGRPPPPPPPPRGQQAPWRAAADPTGIQRERVVSYDVCVLHV